jgi:hypothetical protein
MFLIYLFLSFSLCYAVFVIHFDMQFSFSFSDVLNPGLNPVPFFSTYCTRTVFLFIYFFSLQHKLSNATKKCVIDAQDKKFPFKITNSIATFERVVFSNGNATTRGHWWKDAALNTETAQGGSLLAYNSTML